MFLLKGASFRMLSSPTCCRAVTALNGCLSNHFCEAKMVVEDSGIEPLTYWLQTSRSPS